MTLSDTTMSPLQALLPEMQQGVLFPKLVGAFWLPLDQCQCETEIALHGDQQDAYTRPCPPMQMESQLTLWTLL